MTPPAPRYCWLCEKPLDARCRRCTGLACARCDRCNGCHQVVCPTCNMVPTPPFQYAGDPKPHPHNEEWT